MAETQTDLMVREYYNAIKGPAGLFDLEAQYSRGARVIPVVRSLLGRNKRVRVLDLACGYGRIAIPLANDGYDVSGIDILPSMIRQAKRNARASNLKIDLRVGDMRTLPYADGSFDRVICLWNSFNHLLLRNEQKRTLRETERILAPGGKAFFETMDGSVDPYRACMAKKRPLFRDSYSASIVLYMHDERTLAELACSAGIKTFRTYLRKFDGRRKLILEIERAHISRKARMR